MRGMCEEVGVQMVEQMNDIVRRNIIQWLKDKKHRVEIGDTCHHDCAPIECHWNKLNKGNSKTVSLCLDCARELGLIW